ncbi:MAG TPA: hypothetical protein VFQ68_28925 [Streptosporangiaceae bacterium]|nr:hypothetical protein [Streptosporangiaceae bacterium]
MLLVLRPVPGSCGQALARSPGRPAHRDAPAEVPAPPLHAHFRAFPTGS